MWNGNIKLYGPSIALLGVPATRKLRFTKKPEGTPRAQASKGKTNRTLNSFKKVRYKHYHQESEDNSQNGTKVWKSNIWLKTSIQKIQSTLTAQQRKGRYPIKKRAKDLSRHFSKGDIQMANRCMKRCSMSLAREKQIKATVRYHFTSTRMTITQKTDNSKYWGRCGGPGTLAHCHWDYNMMEPFGKQLISSSEGSDIESPHGTAIPLLEKRRDTSPQTLVHAALTASLFITARKWSHSHVHGLITG